MSKRTIHEVDAEGDPGPSPQQPAQLDEHNVETLDPPVEPVGEPDAAVGPQFVQGININADASVLPQIHSIHNPVGSHISQAMREKIVSGQYIDLENLLESPIDNVNKLSINREGHLILAPVEKKSKITNIQSWSDAFIIYSSIYVSAHPDKAQALLKYMHNIRTGAKRTSGLGWKVYDQQFRLRLASDPVGNSFDKIDYELWLIYMASTSFSEQSSSSLVQGPTTLKCYDFNYRQCFKGNCRYLHLCLNCNFAHPYRYCVRNRAVRGQFRYTWRASGSQGQPRAAFKPRIMGQKPRFTK